MVEKRELIIRSKLRTVKCYFYEHYCDTCTKVKLEKHTPISHDIVEITTLEGSKYQIMDWEIEDLIDKNGELEDIDREDL